MACGCACHLLLMETVKCDLGIYPLWRTLHSVSLSSGCWKKCTGDLQDASVPGNDHCPDLYKLPEKEREPAAGRTRTAVLQGREISRIEKQFDMMKEMRTIFPPLERRVRCAFFVKSSLLRLQNAKTAMKIPGFLCPRRCW